MVTGFESFHHTMSKVAIVVFVVLAIVIVLSFAQPLYKRWLRWTASGLKITSWDNARGIIFGANKFGGIVQSPPSKEGHVFVCGGSGSGKTAGILIPTLQKWEFPFFAVDISGDISANVHPPNSITFAPCDPTTVSYDIFAQIDKLRGNTDVQNEMLEKLAHLLMPDIQGASDASTFFNTEGRKILTAALIAFYHVGLDFTDICKKILSSSWAELFREIDAQKNPIASMYIKSFRGSNEQNTAGCKQSADGSIKLFALNHNACNAIHRPSGNQPAFTPETLEATSVFFVLPDTMLDVYAPLLRIVTAQCLAYFAGRPIGATPTILFALDEFASLGKMDIIGAAQKLRKRGVRIMVITQSLADLDLVYGETERKALLTNFAFKAILGAGDTDTQDYLAKLIGKKDSKKYSVTKGNGAVTYTENQEQVWAVEPSELSQLRNELILLHPSGYERLKKCFYFKYDHLTKKGHLK